MAVPQEPTLADHADAGRRNMNLGRITGVQRKFTGVNRGTVPNYVPIPTKLEEESDDDDRSLPDIPSLILCTAEDAEDSSNDESNNEKEIAVEEFNSDYEDN